MKNPSLIMFFISALILSACSPGELTASKKAEESLEKIIADMEASGEYPILDRTETLGGIDADKNGIRDDIDRIISLKPYTEKQRKAVQQAARLIRRSLTEPLLPGPSLKKLHLDVHRSISCMSHLFENDKLNAPYDGIQLMIEYNSLHTNTRARYLRYREFNSTFNGTTFSFIDVKDACDA
jgi:hypothetical protein